MLTITPFLVIMIFIIVRSEGSLPKKYNKKLNIFNEKIFEEFVVWQMWHTFNQTHSQTPQVSFSPQSSSLDIMQILANTKRLCLAVMGAYSHSESSDHTHECQNIEDYLQCKREGNKCSTLLMLSSAFLDTSTESGAVFKVVQNNFNNVWCRLFVAPGPL